jgi:hypothetical protein
VRTGAKFLLASIGAVGAFATVAGAGSAKATKSKHVTCSVKLYNTAPKDPSGNAFGVANCPRPLGNGVQYQIYKQSVVPPGVVTSSGKIKDFFDRGTIHGTFSITGHFTGAGVATFSGPAKIVGGTDAYKKVKGSGTLSCSTSDGGTTSTCTLALKLTGL